MALITNTQMQEAFPKDKMLKEYKILAHEYQLALSSGSSDQIHTLQRAMCSHETTALQTWGDSFWRYLRESVGLPTH